MSLERLGSALGLAHRGGTWSGARGGVAIELHRLEPRGAELTLRHPGLDRDLWIADPAEEVHGTPVLTGDPAFDGRLRIGARDPLALGIFDVATRRTLAQRLLPGRCSGLSVRLVARGDPTERWVDDGVALAVLLARPLDRLAAVVGLRGDPVPGVRRAADRALVARLREHPELLPMLLASEDPEVSLATALSAGPAGRPTLRRHLRDRRAALVLADAEPDAEVEAALLRHVAHPEVIAALGRVGTVVAVPALREHAGWLSPVGAAAREAIRAIQARAGGVRGGLTLAGIDGGGLSDPDESG